MEASQTPIEQRMPAEIRNRHFAFRADIARRAALVAQKVDRSFIIPNAPFRTPKIQPVYTLVNANPWLHCMWFWDLVNFVPIPPENISVSQIQKSVCLFYGIGKSDLLSPRRDAKVVRARQVAMHISKELTRCSLPEIGRRFGNRDHTTVLHAVRKIERLRHENPKLAEEIRLIKVGVCA